MSLPTGLPLRLEPTSVLTVSSKDGVIFRSLAFPVTAPSTDAAPTPAFRIPSMVLGVWLPEMEPLPVKVDCLAILSIPLSHSFSPSTERIRCCITFDLALSCIRLSSLWMWNGMIGLLINPCIFVVFSRPRPLAHQSVPSLEAFPHVFLSVRPSIRN